MQVNLSLIFLFPFVVMDQSSWVTGPCWHYDIGVVLHGKSHIWYPELNQSCMMAVQNAACQLRGNKKGLQIRLQILKKERYTLVHFDQVACSRRYTEQKECIHIQALSHNEKHVWDGKSRFWSKVLVWGFGLRFLDHGIWSEVFGVRYWSEVLTKNLSI